MGSEVSDEILRSYMKTVKVEDIANTTGRGASDLFPRMVKLFIASKDLAQEIDYKAMGRKWAAVAQSLRIALKESKTESGEPLSTLAYVSVNKADQTIYLRLRPSDTSAGPGRPRKSAK